MRKQKGQAVVEFALVLPIFLFFVWGIIYFGMLYADYLTLSNLARESARAASIQGSAKYADIRTSYSNQTFRTGLYTWTPDTGFAIGDADGDTSAVRVTLTANLNQNFPGVGVLNYLGIPLPATYSVVYSMYKENNT